MKLYLVHCGFYDMGLSDGVYESHINLLVAADSFDDARIRIREHPEFLRRKMHVDGLQEIASVNGFRIELIQDVHLSNETILISNRHRDL